MTDEKTARDIMTQLAPLGSVRLRPMMGEYVLYWREKVIGGIYDNQVLLKKIPAAVAQLPDAHLRTPYPGAHEMLVLQDLSELEKLKLLFDSMYTELPPSRKRRPGRKPA